MKKRRVILAILGLAPLALLSACFSADPDENTVPWGAPANWEGTGGGNMPTVPGQND